MNNKYDVIIIGAGIGGLTAAAILARNGKKVLVLEKNPVAGGYAVNFRRGEFNFDASLHLMNGFNEGGSAHKILEQSGVLDKIQLLKPEYLYRSVFPDFDIRVPQCNLDEYIDILSKYFPSERQGINKLFARMSILFKEVERFIYSDSSLGFESLFLPFKYPALCRSLSSIYQNALDKFLKDQRLKAIISQIWPYYGLPPSKLSCVYHDFATYDYLRNGGYYFKGGAQALTNAFLLVIRNSGGEVILNTEVVKTIIENKKIKGIETNRGDKFLADFIVSNIDARKTFLDLVGKEYLPAKFIAKIEQLEPSISIVQVYLGLNKDLRDETRPDYEIFYNPSYGADKQFEAGLNSFKVEDAMFSLTLYSNIDYAVAPKGKCIVGVTALSGYDYWARLDRDTYRNEKRRVADGLINVAENIIPGLSSYIERVDIATPLTMERYTGSYKGAVYGWSQIVGQAGMNRLSNETPIKNLYLAGAWSRMGGGISIVILSGGYVAKEILRRGKLKR